MAVGDILVYSFIGLAAGVVLFIKGFIWFKHKRLIENIPTSKIRSIAMGLVEIFGEVAAAKDKLLRGPFTNKKCVFYRYTVEQYVRSGKSSYWATIKKDEARSYFYMKDNTGRVLVDTKGAQIDIPISSEFSSGIGRDPPQAIKLFLNKNNISFEALLGINKTMRYREYIIMPGDKLYILGHAGDNPFVKEATARRGVNDIMIQKGKDEPFYYISDKGENDILRKLKWKVLGGLIGGPALIITSLTIIFIYI
jgi:hypothetical protein